MNDPRLRRNELGFLEVVERPTPTELEEYYARRYYQTERGNYRSSYEPAELAILTQRVAQRAQRAAELRPRPAPGSLLDVGCGEGYVLATMAAQGWRVEGIDYARAGVEANNPAMAAQVETGNVFTLLEARIREARRYDLVWLGNVLEHVLDPVGLLRALHRLVATDGLLVVTVPNDGNDYHETLLEDGELPERFWIALPDHLSYFTAESLERTAAATGWRCLDLLADFPIDWFLAHAASNYVRDRAQGPAAHRARLRLERQLGARGAAAANDFYRALARLGLGRNITAYLSPAHDPSQPET